MSSHHPILHDRVTPEQILENIPVGITVIDLQGRMLYYNKYSSTVVNRRPELLGEDIRSCHHKSESISKIDRILREMVNGDRTEYYYESERNGKTLGVTVLPYKVDGKLLGFVQSFVVKR